MGAKCSLARSVTALLLGVAFIAASVGLWLQADLPDNEAVWGIWIGLGCWAWAIVWEALVRSADVDQVVGRVTALVVAVMALMVPSNYLTWERVGLYTLEIMAVISVGFGVIVWLTWISDPSRNPTQASDDNVVVNDGRSP